MMNKLTFIALLEKQINQEIIRLGQIKILDGEPEQTRLTTYQQLVHEI